MPAERLTTIIAAGDTAALDRVFAAQRQAHAQTPYPSREARADRLDRLEQALRRHDAAIREAISEDFGGRAHEETLLYEQFLSIEGIRHARRHLRRWMRPERRRVAWWSLPGRARVLYQPLGVVGVIVPWNYPLYLAIGPLTGALAAGNRALVKMSESTPRVGELFARLIAEAFSAEDVAVVNGGVDLARHFASLPFDHLLFTGSTRVGREVMRLASEHLTPVTLELGGKSPVVVSDGFSLEEAARRADSRRGLLIALPAWFYLTLFFVIPLGIVGVYSFATRSSTGRTVLSDWNFDSYRRLWDSLVVEIAVRTLLLALATTLICLVLAYPLAYFMATRRPAVRNLLLILVMIPFWSNFLVRTYAWKVLLGSDGPLSQLSQALGGEPIRLLFTNTAVIIGLVYGFLPFMVLPLYTALERMDWSLVEAARDLYADGWTAFRKVTWPLSIPGVVAGSILVFIPTLGAYVTPAILGGAKTTLAGDYIVSQFLAARNQPFGSALSMGMMLIMLAATIVYFRWFRPSGRDL